MPEPTPGVCPSECDADCEVGCHEHHAVPWKRHHDPETCPGNLANPPKPRSSPMPEPDTTPAACGCGAIECEICTPISHNITPPAPGGHDGEGQ